jgi:dynein heavy chain, axonemal
MSHELIPPSCPLLSPTALSLCSLPLLSPSAIPLRYAPLLQDIYGYYIDLSIPTRPLKPWETLVEPYQYDPSVHLFNVIVSTADHARCKYILDCLMNAGNDVLLVGESGVGKSSVVSSFLQDVIAGGKTLSGTISYSPHTGPDRLRDVLESTLEKKRKNLLCPPTGMRMCLFIDDLNIPSFDQCGTQQPNELLRQVLDRDGGGNHGDGHWQGNGHGDKVGEGDGEGDQGGFYDVKKLFFKAVRGVVCVATCTPPGD